MTKIVYFIAGSSPTPAEQNEIDAMGATIELGVRNANDRSYSYGNTPEPCDFVAGTAPADYSDTPVYSEGSVGKILYFLAGEVPTTAEQSDIDAIAARSNVVLVRSVTRPVLYGAALEPSDFVAGTVPVDYAAVPVFSLDGPPVDTTPFSVAIWGQSEHQRIISSFNDVLAPEALVAQDRVTFWWHDRNFYAESGVHSVTLNDTTVATTDVTSAMVAMANVFMRHLPNRDIKIIMHTMSGTSPQEIMDDSYVVSGVKRDWVNDWILNYLATADGFVVDYPWHSWFAAPGSWGDNYGQNMFAFIKGRDHDTGALLSYSADTPLAVNGIQISRTLRDIYTHEPKWIATGGAHVFIPTDNLTNATTFATGGVATNLLNKEKSTVSWRNVTRNSSLSDHFSPEVFTINAYANGYDDAGQWTDQSHPSSFTDEGLNRMARLIAHAILRGAGITSYSVPYITDAAWQPDGSYMEFWSDAGPITTPRGGTGPGTDYPHWTDVLGVQIDGQPAQRAEIQPNGRVRVYPNSGAFTSSTVVSFGEGGASGWLQHDADAYAGLWNDYPIVDVGLSDVPGIPLMPLPATSIMASTIAAGSPTFQTSDTGPYFLDTVAVGAGKSAYYGVFVGSIDATQASSTTDILSLSALQIRLEFLTNVNSARLTVKDSANAVLLNSVSSADNVFQFGVEFTAVLSIDLVAGYARVWINGNLVINASFTSVPQQFMSSRFAGMLANNSGLNQFKGTVKRLAVWFEASADGQEPTTTPYKEIAGSASVVNADTWKKGSDAT